MRKEHRERRGEIDFPFGGGPSDPPPQKLLEECLALSYYWAPVRARRKTNGREIREYLVCNIMGQ